ncbi:hypothetical protein X777_08018 [Ooceraea biroi]|uniref:Uncharacterized protein n=1 Tax=Ooceraea biroi TaxID=2015173 RepID=A0A026WBV4_OOCBI|nr:hypothetical protein X777_08018 [Ooceraea biroi]
MYELGESNEQVSVHLVIEADIYQEESFVLHMVNGFRITVNSTIFHASKHLRV